MKKLVIGVCLGIFIFAGLGAAIFTGIVSHGDITVTNNPAKITVRSAFATESSLTFQSGSGTPSTLDNKGGSPLYLHTASSLEVDGILKSENGWNITSNGDATFNSVTVPSSGIVSNGLTVVSNGFGIVSNGLTIVSNGFTIASNGLTVVSNNQALKAPTASPTFTGVVTLPNTLLTINAIGAADSVGLALTNGTAAANGAQQYSPSLRLGGQGFKSTGSVSQNDYFDIYVTPVQGSANSTAILQIFSSIAGGANVSVVTITSGGVLACGGFTPSSITVNAGGGITSGNTITTTQNGIVSPNGSGSGFKLVNDGANSPGIGGYGNLGTTGFMDLAPGQGGIMVAGGMGGGPTTITRISGMSTNGFDYSLGGTTSLGFTGVNTVGAMCISAPSGSNVICNVNLQSAGLTTTISNGLAGTAITFPATTATWTNTLGFNIVLYIDNSGITGTALSQNGSTIFSGLANDVTLCLKTNDFFSETYTVGTPSAKWFPR